MKIHVLGSSGMLGSYISRYLSIVGYDVVTYNRNNLEVFNFNINKFKKQIKTEDTVINCIGLLKPDISSYEQAVVVNHNFPLILDLLSVEVGCRLVNFSSDCVYSGLKGNYNETDICDATDFYGLTKKHDSLKKTVMRLSFIGESQFRLSGFLEFALKNKGRVVNGYSNCLWNGVTGLEVAKLIDRMIRNDGVFFWSGVRHVFSSRVITKFELLKIVNQAYDLNLRITEHIASSITGTVINDVLDRSLNTIYTPLHLPTIEEMVIEQREFKIKL
jgi:dTDP-4-dehydrorhamnose reductase